MFEVYRYADAEVIVFIDAYKMFWI